MRPLYDHNFLVVAAIKRNSPEKEFFELRHLKLNKIEVFTKIQRDTEPMRCLIFFDYA